MPEAPWRQRFRWTLPTNPWETLPHRAWSWFFQDEHGNAWGRWYIQPFDGGERRLAAPDLPPAYSTGLAAAHDFAIVGSARSDGFTVHQVQPGLPSQLIFQDTERVDVGTLSTDEALISLLHAQNGDWQHPHLRVVRCDGTPIAQLSDGLDSGLRAGSWSPIPHDQRLIVLRESTGWWRPSLWSPETGELIDPPIDLPGEVDAQWYPDAHALLLNHEWHGRNELYRFDLTNQHMSKIATSPGAIWATGFRPDGTIWYRWNDATRPSEIHSEDGEVLPRGGDSIPHGVPYQDIDVAGIHALLANPSGAGPHPTIFLVYGHPTFHYRDAFWPAVQAWVDHGFAVVILNCRGSNGYGKTWRDASLRNVGWTEMEDIARVYDWIVAAGIADPRRIVLNGGSWGGYLTLFGLGAQPERWSLGLAEYPVGDFVACYEDASPAILATVRVQFGGTPDEVPAAYQKGSPLTYVDRVQAPVMLIVGEYDHLCPIRQNKNYIARLQTLGKPHEVLYFPGGHGTTDGEEQIRQIEAEIRFVARHLGTPLPR